MRDDLLLIIADSNDKERRVPVRFQVVCTETNFSNTYESAPAPGASSAMKLSIVHTDGRPNEYWLSQPPQAAPKKLTPAELSLPFAGSDFWAADLGLEFLHWPEQRVIRSEMRRYVFCKRLESVNPHPAPGGYSKIVSWIGANRPEELVLVHADAYDAKGKLLKQFDPKKLEKINGVRELEEMEIRNRQADTHTIIKFQLDERHAGKSP